MTQPFRFFSGRGNTKGGPGKNSINLYSTLFAIGILEVSSEILHTGLSGIILRREKKKS